ncbi:MAG TPA: hypothetical protein VLN73_06275 [Alphaproteobacteria bacterium]|nr:hypothetical protein [Alphaproteobacteria bacterium]
MITSGEISVGLYGAWRLAKGDKSGLAFFDATAEGALRSFHAALLALPIAALYLGLDLSQQPISAPLLKVLVVFLLAFALDWAAYPLVVMQMAPAMNCDDKVLLYIPALNWARVLELIVLMPAAFAGVIFPEGLAGLIRLVLMGAVMVYHWFVAKSALGVTGAQAAFLVLLNMVLGIVIGLWALALVGARAAETGAKVGAALSS